MSDYFYHYRLNDIQKFKSDVDNAVNDCGLDCLNPHMFDISTSLQGRQYHLMEERTLPYLKGIIDQVKEMIEATAKNTQEVSSSDADMSGIGNLISSGSDSRGAKLMGGVFGSMKQKSSTVVEQKVPRKKAIRAAMITASDYVSCVLVKRDECLAEFEAQDKRRRSNTLDNIDFAPPGFKVSPGWRVGHLREETFTKSGLLVPAGSEKTSEALPLIDVDSGNQFWAVASGAWKFIWPPTGKVVLAVRESQIIAEEEISNKSDSGQLPIMK